MIATQGKAQRTQIQANDVTEPERLRKVLNDALLELSTRIEALELVRGITLLDEVFFETTGAVTPSDAPFSLASGGIRVTCPFSPTGLFLLRLENVGTQAVPSSSSDVKWHFAAGPGTGTGVLHIDFVTGLAINSRYKMRLGVTRA